ncbi:sporulation protein YqfD [Paenibacillus sp.]|uniref:sporulation protein YqfD n=1 Tax=Paenibacillus sp. TaxID=58172 RepID=UPI002D6F6FC8|nr:sporulation protein YqfD [Paenibacillus sp.]HZG55863.1 sporulation protein YqfD [Paenibacillus sp.]
MNSQLIRYLRGYVKLAVVGPAFERLINRLVEKGVPAWDIRRIGDGRGEFLVALPDYFRLKPLLRETSCRMRTTGRYGFPFFLDKLGRRKWFVGGAVAFLLGMYMLSQVVWSVEVSGNETIPEQHVLQEAAAQGIYPLQWRFRLQDPGELADRLTRTIPNVAWVGVEMRGSTVEIRIVEAVVPQKKPAQNPRHLVSSSDAVITRIIADRGVPLVGVHSRVKRGDILISGILGDEENREVVVAEGEVRGLVWYEYKVQAPIERQHEALTGNERSTFHLVLGGRALQLTGYWQKPFARERVEAERKQLRFGPWTAPLGWMTVTHREATLTLEKRSVEQAKATGLANARADLIAALGGDTVIRAEKILHERTDNGKVIVHVLFEAEVNVAVERAIMEQELAPPEKTEGRS